MRNFKTLKKDLIIEFNLKRRFELTEDHFKQMILQINNQKKVLEITNEKVEFEKQFEYNEINFSISFKIINWYRDLEQVKLEKYISIEKRKDVFQQVLYQIKIIK